MSPPLVRPPKAPGAAPAQSQDAEPQLQELRQLRAEAAALLGIEDASKQQNTQDTTDGPPANDPARADTVEDKPDF